MRKLLAHEALIVAIDEISKLGHPIVGHDGVDCIHLSKQKLTAHLTDGEVDAALAQAREAGWVLENGLTNRLGPRRWVGMTLSHDGLVQVADLTRPWWRTALAALGGDVRTVLVAGIIAVVSAVLTTLVLNLLD